jgi:hypothetical protein
MNLIINLIILLVITCIYIYITCPNLHLDNSYIPFYKRQDGKFPVIPERSFLTVLLTSGLSNRVRTMLGFIRICKHFKKNLIVVWIKDETCNGNYLDYFKPIEGVEFIDCKSMINIKDIDYIGQSTTQAILQNYGVTDCKNNYSYISLVNSLQDVIDEFVNKNNINECVGIHVRRTDYTGNLIGKILNGNNPDLDFCNYIEKYSNGKKYFLATDNKQTQEYYIKKYGNRTIFYSNIKETNRLRKTDLKSAIIDIYILSHCRSIKGTLNSSFTEFARLLQKSRNY